MLWPSGSPLHCAKTLSQSFSHRFFLPVLRHPLAFKAKVARRLVLGFLDRLSCCNFDLEIFLPFLVFVVFRSLPRFDFLILMPERRRLRLATIEPLWVISTQTQLKISRTSVTARTDWSLSRSGHSGKSSSPER
jgi:hypothetical protein